MRRDWLTLAGMGEATLVCVSASLGPGVQGWRDFLAGERNGWVFLTVLLALLGPVMAVWTTLELRRLRTRRDDPDLD